MAAQYVDRISRRLADRLSRRAALCAGAASLAASNLIGASFAQATPAFQGQATPEAKTDWDDVDRQLAALAPQTALLAAEIVDGQCQPVHAFNADQPLASASTFKLFILGELARQVEAGGVAWEQPLAIQERFKSVPHGDLLYAPDGTAFTVRYLAERMIQVSDNTATDHLLFFLGRENVERILTTMGVADPARDIPLLSTREFAVLKLAYPKDQLADYVAAPVAERRRILAEEIDTMPLSVFDTLPDQTAPEEIERAEWFFTRDDLCRAMAALQVMARQPGLLPVREILALESQLPFNAEVWPYVGFKGGSELGVLSGTWLLERADGRHFVYSVVLNNPTAGIDMAMAATVMGAGRDLLAETP
jgi:beta-lactamase class A